MPKRAEKYIEQVQKGQVIVGEYIKLAIKRHLSDLKKAKKRDFPYFFSPTHAQGAIEAFELQRLAFGEHTDEPFVLMNWQACILYMAYGWRRKVDHRRRFVKVYIKVARGNAKTEFLAGVGNLGFFFESEKDPQIYWVATKKEQAKIGFGRQKTMAQRLRRDYIEVAEMCDTSVSRIYETNGVGYVTYLGKDSKTEDGFSPLYGLVDEYHAHPNDDMIHVIESGTIKRISPMIWIITTAGNNPVCPCAEFEKRAKQMLKGDMKNDQLLAFCYDLDEGDNWQDPANWVKPNPSIGVSVHMNSLVSEYEKALTEGIQKENNFKTKNLNIWVASRQAWISDDKFRASGRPFDPAILDGQLCFGGLDLSKNRDLTALALFFPGKTEKDKHHVIFKIWCPEDNATERTRLDGVPYTQWARDGWMKLTPGDIIDTDYIKADLLDGKLRYKFHSCAYDRWRATELVTDIQEEVGECSHTETKQFMEPFTQTAGHFSAPLTQLEKMILKKQLNHGRNPIIEWMNRNVVIFSDTNGNIKIDKQKAKEKVDGMVALAMAIGQWMTYKHQYQEAYSPDSDIIVL
jgi:phage terminase large subunit-like protein